MNAPSRRWWLAVLSLAVLAAWSLGPVSLGYADSPGEPKPAETASPQAATPTPPSEPPKLDTGDNAWVLTSSALVLMMTGPGLALFYSGLVRKKNVLGVMMQCVFLMCLMTVIWALWGYTLAFGGDAPGPPPKWLGNADHLFMRGVEATWQDGASVIPVHPALSINRLTHMLFQGMFFIITPALICGAFAERMKFSTMVVFMILWGTLGLLPAGPLGLGRRNPAYGSKHAHSGRGPRLRRRYGGPHQLGRLGPGLRFGDRQADRLRQPADAAAQPDLYRHRGDDALGRLVRVQRRQRLGRQRSGRQRLLRHALRRGGRGPDLGQRRVDHSRQAHAPGHLLGRGGGPGVHHSGRRLRDPDVGAWSWAWPWASSASGPAPT